MGEISIPKYKLGRYLAYLCCFIGTIIFLLIDYLHTEGIIILGLYFFFCCFLINLVFLVAVIKDAVVMKKYYQETIITSIVMLFKA